MWERSQAFLVWWSLVLAVAYGLTLGLLLHMVGPPSATLTADQVAVFYREHQTSIRAGAMLASWTGMFIAPLWCVLAAQIWRQEQGRTPVWTITAGSLGPMMGLFLAAPPICWGVAAFTPTRAPEITATFHELGVLTFVTTDQIFVFNFAAVVAIALLPQAADYSPFPRWYGYFSLFWALVFEVGAVGFVTKVGPFSWNGLFVFWLPVIGASIWIPATAVLLLRALKRQRLAATGTPAPALPVKA